MHALEMWKMVFFKKQRYVAVPIKTLTECSQNPVYSTWWGVGADEGETIA